MVRTVAPRRAARIASSPQPVPISSTRVPGADAGLVEQPLDLAQLGGSGRSVVPSNSAEE